MALLLDSLRIENYRVFKRLEIERLGRVNLLVGKNNSGKSSVLEAVRLYASRGAASELLSILESHDELRPDEPDVYVRFKSIQQLFHGRDSEWSPRSFIRIGPLADREMLSIRIDFAPATSEAKASVSPERTTPSLVTSFEDHEKITFLERDWRFSSADLLRAEPISAYVPPNGVADDEAARLWDHIALTDWEKDVIAALRVISPEIERISFIGESSRKRIPVAKLSSLAQPVPMRSLGDGVNRMMGIALSAVSAAGGVLLIDEIENGIHFKAQKRLWELIFHLAEALNVQVFATTHSMDCINAFQRAAAQDQHEEARLIRLDLRKDVVVPVAFSEDELAIVTRDQIEVR